MVRIAVFLVALFFSFVASAQSGVGGAASSPNPYAQPSNGVFVCFGEPSAGAGSHTFNCNEPFNDTFGRTPRNLVINTGIRNLVLIVAGQSNRQAVAATPYVPTNASAVDNFNIMDGAIYPYVDPPLGSSYMLTAIPGGGPGHVGGRIADKFITNGIFDRVIVVPIGIGGSVIADWATGGRLQDKFCVTMARLAARGITPATTNVTFAVDWGQGESDNGVTSQANYQTRFGQMYARLQACGFVGRFFISKESWLANTVDANIQSAQAALVNNPNGLYAGADADSIGSADRVIDVPPSGTTHFKDSGNAALATLIYNAMHASGAPF